MAAKFVVKKTNTGYNFLLVATNGQPIGSSQVYSTLASAQAGVEAVRKASAAAVVLLCYHRDGDLLIHARA